MKIVDVVTIRSCGPYSESKHWEKTKKQIHNAVRRCVWPIVSGSFTIYPQSGKKRGEGNGVKPIKSEFIALLKKQGWAIEGKAKNALDQRLGDFRCGPSGSRNANCRRMGNRKYLIVPSFDEQTHYAPVMR